MNVLAFIPARGGSKGLPMKNIRKLAKMPLIKHSILTAKKSKVFDKIIVSTDNKKIAQIAKNSGAEVPFLRPKNISQNNSTTLEAIKHALYFLENEKFYVPDIIVVLQPTSPLRIDGEIKKAVNILKKSNATSVISVKELKTHPHSSFFLKSEFLKPFNKDFERYSLRQKKPILYYPTGALYVFWTKTLKKYNSTYGPRIKPIISKQDEFNTDIDSLYDFFILEQTLLNWKKYNNKQK